MSKDDQKIQLQVEGELALLTLGRAHCLDSAGKIAIAAALRSVAASPGAVRALIVHASHSAAWLVNVAELVHMEPAEARVFSQGGHGVAAAIAALPLPVIAAVDGPALGGGCELVLACDLAFAGEEATFGQIEALGGVMPAFGGTWRLEERVGYQRALAMMFTGEVIDAVTARQYGLVLEVFPSVQLLERTKEFARRVAAVSAQSVAAIKRTTRAGRGAPAALRDQLEEDAFPLLFGTQDQRKRMQAALEHKK